MFATVTATGVEKERPPLVDVATRTGEWALLPLNCAHVT
jgi:hypothetical protein